MGTILIDNFDPYEGEVPQDVLDRFNNSLEETTGHDVEMVPLSEQGTWRTLHPWVEVIAPDPDLLYELYTDAWSE